MNNNIDEIMEYLEQFQGKTIEIHLVGKITSYRRIEKMDDYEDGKNLVILGANIENQVTIRIDEIDSYWLNGNGKIIINIGEERSQQIWIGLARD